MRGLAFGWTAFCSGREPVRTSLMDGKKRFTTRGAHDGLIGEGGHDDSQLR